MAGMSLVSMPSIFLGVTPAPVRRYLGTILGRAAERYDRMILPCAGRFSGTKVALNAGFKPGSVFASDISLFSGLIGNLAAGKDPRALQSKVAMPEIPELEVLANDTADGVDHAAAVMVAMKIATTKPSNAYAKLFWSDLRGDWRRHHETVKENLLKLLEQIRGINYQPADLFEEVRSAAPDPKAIVYLAPPDVSGGYIKMFNFEGMVTFAQPAIENFDPKGGFEKLAEITNDARALILTLQPHDDRKNEKHPDAVFAALGGNRLHVLHANRKDDALALGRASVNNGGVRKTRKFPVWGGIKDVITPESKVMVTKAKSEEALYYRDLFAHRLGASNAESMYLVWLDSKVFATVGMNLMFAMTGRPYDPTDPRLHAWQQFAMGAHHDRYKHLSRLLNMILTCEEFLAVLKKTARFPMGDPAGVRTACITKVPEAKHLRGIMKLQRRETRDDGQFMLHYATDWRPGGFQAQVAAWCAKYPPELPGGEATV